MKLAKHLPRFRKAYRELATLADRERWSRSEIEAFQLECLNAVWKQAVTHVPYYDRLQNDADLPSRFDSLQQFQAGVPVLPGAQVRKRPMDFLSENLRRGSWGLTGGSTGLPAKFYCEEEAHQRSNCCKYRFYARWGVDIFDRVAFLWGHGHALFEPGISGYIARLRQPLEDRLRNRLRLSAYLVGREELQDYLRQLAAFQPAYIYAYASAAYLLAREAIAAGFRCDSLKFVCVAGEPALPHLVDEIENAFGTPVIVEYGSTDCGFLAGQWVDGTLRVREDRVLMETLPRDDGRFDIVVTVLDNPSFPLIRYAIGDVTDAPLQRPERGFAVLKNVAGRNNDSIIARSGRHIHASLLYEILEHDEAIRCYRIDQQANGAIEVRVELFDPATPFDSEALGRKVEDLSDGYLARVERVDRLERSPAGKHRWITSEMANPRQTVGN